MTRETCAGFVLSASRFSETSLMVSLFTAAHGRVSALAKGALRKGSPFAASLEPFALCEFQLSFKETREVQLLTASALLDYFRVVREDIRLSAAAQTAVELIRRTVHEGEAQPALYRLLSAYLSRLNRSAGLSAGGLERLILAFELHFLKVMGFGPSFHRCGKCGETPLGPKAAVSARAGGALCQRCAGGAPDAHRAPGRLLAELDALYRAKGDAVAASGLSDPGAASDIVCEMLSAVFEKDMRLNCIEFFHTL